VGAAVAYFLAERGVAVTVVERTGVACAASASPAASSRWTGATTSPLGRWPAASFALTPIWRASSRDYGYGAWTPFMLAAREGATVARRPPDARAVVDRRLRQRRGGVGSTETTAQVHPARFTEALLDRRAGEGAILRRAWSRGCGARRRGSRHPR